MRKILNQPRRLFFWFAFSLCFSDSVWNLRSSPESAGEGLLEAEGTVQAALISGVLVRASHPLLSRENSNSHDSSHSLRLPASAGVSSPAWLVAC
jgi:hypothetical protein